MLTYAAFYYAFLFAIVKSANDYTNYDDVCVTDGCRNIAKLVRYNIDESIDPCDDFYTFACGGYMSKTSLPKDVESFNRLNGVEEEVLKNLTAALHEDINECEPHIFQVVKSLYKTCMDTEAVDYQGSKPISKIIRYLGGWPVLDRNWDDEDFDWVKTDVKIRKLGLTPQTLMSFDVTNDHRDARKFLLYIEEMTPFVVPATNIRQGKWGRVVSYKNFMVDTAVTLGATKNHAQRELDRSLDLERELFIAAYADEDNGETMTIKNLTQTFPYIPWSTYLNNMTKPFTYLTDTDEVRIFNYDYFKKLGNILQKYKKRDLANYMVGRAIAQLAPHSHAKFRELYYRLSQSVKKDDLSSMPRSKHCIRWLTSKSSLMVGTSSLYVRKYVKKEVQQAMKPVMDWISSEFQQIFLDYKWIDKKTKSAMLKKFSMMKFVIAYPYELFNDSVLDEYTKQLKVDERNHLNNFLNVNRFIIDYAMSCLHKKTDTHYWPLISDSTDVMAYYIPLGNILAAFAGILQRPIFSPDWPMFAKFGGIGLIIGHEMGHAYDTYSIEYDMFGNHNTSWHSNNTDTVNKYVNITQCLIDQYNDFTEPNLGWSPDGEKTLDENIADSIGIKVSKAAYDSWRKEYGKEKRIPGYWYTPDQLFYIMSANYLCVVMTDEHKYELYARDTHTPENVRVLGTMANTGDFAKAFKCSSGTRMNPVNKCDI